MTWISKKALADLEREINNLDPKKIAQDAIKNLGELPRDVQEQIRGIVRSEIGNLPDRLDENVKKIDEQKAKIEEFISSSKKLVKMILPIIVSRIEKHLEKIKTDELVGSIKDIIEEAFGKVFEEKPKDEKILNDEEIPTDKEETAAESEQQAAGEEIPDST